MYKNIQRKSDGSFVVEKNGQPYHIPNNEEFKEEYVLMDSLYIVHPEKVSEYKEVVIEQPVIDERLARLNNLKKESNELYQDIIAEIASDEDKARFKSIRKEIKALKAEMSEG